MYQEGMNDEYTGRKKKKGHPILAGCLIVILCLVLVTGIIAVAGLGIFAAGKFMTTNANHFDGSLDVEKIIDGEDEEPESKVSISTTEGSEIETSKTTSESGVVITDVSDVVNNVMPAIVAITGKFEVEDYGWFGEGGVYEQEGSGSGIIVGETSEELLIVTNNHVVAGATSLSVQFINDKSVNAIVKGTDENRDLAIVAIPMDDIENETREAIKIAVLGSSDDLSVGEGVIAIGNALGYGQSVTTGVVSALNREVKVDNTTLTLIQTDAAINGGNSGGALINGKGEVIGINVAKYSSSSYSSSASIEGMGFAIPVSQAADRINELMNKKTRTKVDEAKRGYLGIAGYTVSEGESEIYGVPVGVLVTEVSPGSAAASAGIKEKDVITKIDGDPVSTIDALKDKLEYFEAGEEVEITIQHRGASDYEEKTVKVILGKADSLPKND